MSSFEHIEYAVSDQVATISLNRPKVGNCMSLPLLAELNTAMREAENEQAVRVVVLRANGKNFCVGADLRDEEAQAKPVDEHLMNDHAPNLQSIKDSNKIYICAVQGAAAGIGSSYAMLCDITLMAEDAYIYQAFLPIGLVPDGGASWLLGRQLGYKRAFKMMIEGTKVDAQTCLDWGLASEVVASEELNERAQQMAISLCSKAPLAVAATKQLLHGGFTTSYEGAVEEEAKQQLRMQDSEDANEGINAFLEKRTAEFKGV